MADAWYYLKGDQQIGPMPRQAFQDAAARGELTAQTYVWTEGMAQWLPAAQVPGLLPMAVPPPPVAPSAPAQVPAYAATPVTFTMWAIIAGLAAALFFVFSGWSGLGNVHFRGMRP